MKNYLFLIFLASITMLTFAQNPLIMNQFTADPTARVFEGKVYVYPSHDIICDEGKGYIGFCMADYHVFSSSNLTDWKDHGVVLTQDDVPWVDSESFSMWAPDCVFRNGKYYFYFPAISKDTTIDRWRTIGVATADKPYGPFIPEEKPIKGISGIDPGIFIDKDDKAYIYWANNKKIYVSQLRDNMLELKTEPKEIAGFTDKFKEGPFLFERKDIYYLTYPYVESTTEQLVYAVADNPMGPFEYKGIIMKESPIACWTNHQSIVEYEGQYYLFYHHNDLSPKFDKNRSMKADSLFFNEDGGIVEVIPSRRGVGISDGKSKIQVDRYSNISDKGVSLEFINPENTFQGWKVILEESGSWLRYNRVELGDAALNKVQIKGKSDKGGIVQIRLDGLNGPVIAEITLKKSNDWSIAESQLKKFEPGIHDLYIISKSEGKSEIDWVRFMVR